MVPFKTEFLVLTDASKEIRPQSDQRHLGFNRSKDGTKSGTKCPAPSHNAVLSAASLPNSVAKETYHLPLELAGSGLFRDG